jgi:hypothetical protein
MDTLTIATEFGLDGGSTEPEECPNQASCAGCSLATQCALAELLRRRPA